MPIKKAKQINLLPQDYFESSTFGRILKWALSSFRVMVIVTELVVMMAFLSRFWLDAQNSDLNENIDIQKSQVTAYRGVEKQFRNYQSKIAIIKELYQDVSLGGFIQEVTNNLPTDIRLTSIQITNLDFQIKALSFTESSISKFIKNIEGLSGTSNIKLTQVSSNTDDSNTLMFTISGQFKKEENK